VASRAGKRMGGYGPRGLAAALSGPGQLFWYAYATLAFQTNISTRHVLRSMSQLCGRAYSFPSGRGRQMIAEPVEPRVSKLGQALAIGFITFLVILSIWELLAIRL
jgi:hypothetical protein